MFRKSLSILLSVILLMSTFTVLPFTANAKDMDISKVGTQSRANNFSTNYALTGDGATDIVAIALAQNNRSQGSLGYTEGWCADFTSDCARLAGQESAIPFNGGVSYLYNAIVNAGGWAVSFPQKGDIAFFDYAHVGIMVDSVNCISGNMWDNSGSYVRTYNHSVMNQGSTKRFLRPNYTNSKPATNAWLNIDRSEIVTGEAITFHFGADNANGLYTIGIDKGNNRIITENIRSTTYSYTFNQAGDYSAYVTCYGDGGLADTNRVYFKVYENIPASNAWIKINKNTIEQGESITFTYGADHSNGYYTIGIDKGNKRIHTKDIRTNSYTYTFNEEGEYSAYVTCYGYGGLADTKRVYFTVTKPFAASNAWIKINKDAIEKGQSISFTYGAEHSNGYFTIGIDKGDKRIHTKDIQTNSYTYTFSEAGDYSAYVTCYGNAGLADTKRVYFKVYDKFPALNAWIRTDNDRIVKGQSITFTYGAEHSNGYFTIGIDKDNKRIHTKDIQTSYYQYTFNEVGNYSAYVTCYGDGGLADTERVFITVYENLLGDVDGDGEVSIVDATHIQRYNAQLQITIDIETLLKCGDIDGDDEVTVLDSTLIQRYNSQMSISYPIGEPI